MIITGGGGTSILIESIIPATDAVIPATHPTTILFSQDLAVKTDKEAGIIKNAKTVSIPAILTASITTRPNVK